MIFYYQSIQIWLWLYPLHVIIIFHSQVLHDWWRSIPVLHSEQSSDSQQDPLHSDPEGGHVQGEGHHAKERVWGKN